MPFGAIAAPDTQQYLLDEVLGDMQWRCALGYLDDVIIYSDSLEEHYKHIAAFLARVAAANLQLKPQKCKLFCTELRYLGFIVSAEGFHNCSNARRGEVWCHCNFVKALIMNDHLHLLFAATVWLFSHHHGGRANR